MNKIAILRKQLRQQRRHLTVYQQRQAEQAILTNIYHHALFKTARKIGVYIDDFGEISTKKLINYCFKLGKKVYTPQVCEMNQILTWVEISKAQYHHKRMVRHRLKMLEARASRGQSVKRLDVLFMPLLVCDKTGIRIGMGGGFYDRTLANAKCRPYRIGLAHDFQYIDDNIPAQKWDQRIDELWTPSHRYCFKRCNINYN